MIGYINGKEVSFEPDETILTVARRNGHFIPTLCEMADLNHTPGTCRVCLVEMRLANQTGYQVVTSCTTPMAENIDVLTRTPRVRQMQRLQVELLLADHNQDCASCIRHGNCELQDVAQFVGLQQTRYHYPHFYEQRTRDFSSQAVVRDMSKCIRCFRCVSVCREIQGVDALVITEKGLETEISVRDGLPLGSSACVGCGQCILVCPVGALAEKNDIETVQDFLYDPSVITVFQFAPAVRTALGEEFGLSPGINVEGKLITALKALGADLVLDTNFAADLVIMEEGSELLNRLEKKRALPMFTSCCPAWISYVEKNYPDFTSHVSTTRSPQQCFGAIAKTFLAQKAGWSPEQMRVVSIMPCTAKKGEAQRPEFSKNGRPDVDVVLTTRELARLLRREGIALGDLEPDGFDNPWMGTWSGAAVIFGSTGGVMEAAVRTVHQVVTGKELGQVIFDQVRGDDRVREATVDFGDGKGSVKVAVVHTLKAADKILKQLAAGQCDYHFVEVMACPGGCAGGGGQPRSKHAFQAGAPLRREGLYQIDETSAVRQSHNNPQIAKLYKEFLGAPLGHKSHELLHTRYMNRSRKVSRTMSEIWREIEERA